MRIVKTKQFISTLQQSLDYIARDKVSASFKFKKELDTHVNNLINFPYKYRKSYYHKDETIRDMTFKGYTIIYRIDEAKEFIEILEMFHKNLPTAEEK
jgi:plasmid stabilization system protein ParE